MLKESCGVTDDWLLETVAPNILLQFPREVALTLARPLLWAVFEPHLQGYLPDTLTERVRLAYAFVRRLPAAANPVEKIPIIVQKVRYLLTKLVRISIKVYARWYHKGNSRQVEHNDV